MNHEAIYNTHPNVVSIDDGKGAMDANGNPIILDQSLVDTEAARLKAEYDSKAYARNRQTEYPSINELVVAMWGGVVEERMASVTRLEALRQAVKTRYPK